MVVAHNLLAMNANRQFNINTNLKAKSTEKLSSGYKINRASDDAAGLSISEKMRWQIRGLNRGSKNIQDGISLTQVADGALNEVHSMVHRIRELAIQSANGTNSDEDRAYIQEEVKQIKKEISRTFNTTDFNGMEIFRTPYTLGVSGEPTDIKMFNTSQSSDISARGGFIFDNRRYTWGELGAKVSNGIFTEDFAYKATGANGETIELEAKKGDSVNDVKRYYQVTSDQEGIYVNNKPAARWEGTSASGKWASVNQVSFDDNTYSFLYNGVDISFTVEDGDDIETIINNLNPDSITSERTMYYTAEVSGGSNEVAVNIVSWIGADDMFLDVTEANKYEIADYQYAFLADDSGLTIKQISGDDGITHRKVAWSDFKNINTGEEFRFNDWGLEDEGTNPQTFSSEATYSYKDITTADLEKPLYLTFTVKDEASKEAIFYAFNNKEIVGLSIHAPLKAGGNTDNSNVSIEHSGCETFEFQRDVLGRTFDESVSSIEGDINRSRDYSGTVSSYIETENGYVVDKIYRLYTNNYSYTNSDGDTVMTTQGIQHIDMRDGVIDSEGNIVDTTTYGTPVSFIVTNADGTTSLYSTQFDNESIVFTHGSAHIDVTYNNTTDTSDGSNNSNVRIDIIPTREAYGRAFPLWDKKAYSYRTDYDAVAVPPQNKSLWIQAGSQQDNGIELEWSGMTLSSIGLGGANVSTQDGALRTLGKCDKAIEKVSEARSTFGAYQNRLEHSFNVNSFTAENLQASESRIRDTDMAEEMVRYTKQNILEQAVMSMLSQANQSQQGVLSLLAG